MASTIPPAELPSQRGGNRACQAQRGSWRQARAAGPYLQVSFTGQPGCLPGTTTAPSPSPPIVPAPQSPPRPGCSPGAGRGTRGCQALPGAQPHAVPACWRSAHVSAARAASNHGNGFSSRPGVGLMMGERSSSRCGQHAWGVCERPRGPRQPGARAVLSPHPRPSEERSPHT